MSLEKEFNGHRWLTIEENSELAKNAVSDIPEPAVADAGKALIVGEDGKYELGEVSGGERYIDFTPANEQMTRWNVTGESISMTDWNNPNFDISNLVFRLAVQQEGFTSYLLMYPSIIGIEESTNERYTTYSGTVYFNNAVLFMSTGDYTFDENNLMSSVNITMTPV